MRRQRRQARLRSVRREEVRQKRLKGSYRGSMSLVSSGGNTADPMDVVAPIIKAHRGSHVEIVGTGFFVSTGGLFVTAAHVLDEIFVENSPDVVPYIVQFRKEGYVPRPIAKAVCHAKADIGFGVSGGGATLRLRLSADLPVIPSEVATYAYPMSTVRTGDDGIFMEVAPDYFGGIVTKHYPNGRDKTMLPGHCFETTVVIHAGASGGPVFDRSGSVFAVSSCSLGTEHHSHITPISEAMDLRITGSPSLRELSKSGDVAIV